MAVFINSLPIITSGLVLNLDAAITKSYPKSGTIWNDLSGNNNNGTLIGGPTYSTLNNGTLLFSGTNQYVDIPSSNIPLNNVTQFSYSAFVNFNTKTPGNAFFSYGVEGQFSSDILFGWSGGILFFQINNGSDGSGEAQYSYSPFNSWISLSVVYNGSLSGNSNRLKVYINGNEVTSTYSYTVPATTASPSSPLCRLGVYVSDNTNGWALNGRIANTLLYNRALSVSEIQQNYNIQKTRFGL